MLSADLLSIVACPVCNGPLAEKEEGLVCDSCRLVFPIEDGIPVLLVSEAVEVQP